MGAPISNGGPGTTGPPAGDGPGLLTFDNSGNSLVPMRAFFISNEICMAFLLNKCKVYLAKMNNLPKHHGAGPQRRGAQCGCIGCIDLRPALLVTIIVAVYKFKPKIWSPKQCRAILQIIL